MIGSSRMQKVSQKRQFLLTLLGLALLAAFLIGCGVKALITGTSVAFAAVSTPTTPLQETQEDCVEGERKPSFGSATVVSENDVVCGDLTSFGGKVTIHGDV